MMLAYMLAILSAMMLAYFLARVWALALVSWALLLFDLQSEYWWLDHGASNIGDEIESQQSVPL